MEIRKSIVSVEEVVTDGGKPLASPIHRATAVVVVKNPFAGRFADDLSPLFDVGFEMHFDTLTIAVPDAPRPDEIIVVVAVADGGRPHPRVGKGRAVV